MTLLNTVGSLKKYLEDMPDDDVLIYDIWLKKDILNLLYSDNTAEESIEDCDQFIIWLTDNEPYPSHPQQLREAHQKWLSLSSSEDSSS